jgi:hypothetical protein
MTAAMLVLEPIFEADRPRLPSSFVGFFGAAVQPPLNQMPPARHSAGVAALATAGKSLHALVRVGVEEATAARRLSSPCSSR